jgi:hypothetical protein
MTDPFSSLRATESSIWDTMASNADYAFFDDTTAKALYHEAFFAPGDWDPSQLQAIREDLRDYLMNEYGFDFDAEFDWEAWREAYGSA